MSTGPLAESIPPVLGKHMIHPQSQYGEDGISTFLKAEERLGQLLYPTVPDGDRLSENQPEKQRGRYQSSPVPALTIDGSTSSGSATTSTLYNLQMYSLSTDSNGILSTNRNLGPTVINATPREGDYQCLFAFDDCQELCTLDTWKEHVNSHLSDVVPPESCRCSICGEPFEAGDPHLTWSRFLDHVLNHRYRGQIAPDQDFLEFCRENDLISELTMGRYDPHASAQRVSQEPYQYRQQTPRRFMTPRGLAQVEYPSTWGEETQPVQRPMDVMVNRAHVRDQRAQPAQRPMERDVMVNRAHLRDQRAYRP